MNNRSRALDRIERMRGSKVITYFVGDRPGAPAQIFEDAVRPMYDHLRAIQPAEKIDLFLYSTGGLTDVPWRIVTMIREFTDNFSVLVPYKAMSAATMVALGADEIVMGRKGELGPIDPQMSIARGGEGETVVTEQIAVEDVMSYLQFVDAAGVQDGQAIAQIITNLSERITPTILGQINRAHSHIRDVARKLLSSHSDSATMNDAQIKQVTDSLAEQTYQHGHAIGRREAKGIGLNITEPEDELEQEMWQFFEEYETLCKLREPIDPRTFIPQGRETAYERLIMACIESSARPDHFTSDLHMKRLRQPSPQLTLNLNVNLQVPDELQADQLPPAVQQSVNDALQQLQQNASNLMGQALNEQMPYAGVDVWHQSNVWRQQQGWPN